jgi:hypothetical protein
MVPHWRSPQAPNPQKKTSLPMEQQTHVLTLAITFSTSQPQADTIKENWNIWQKNLSFKKRSKH